VFRVPAAHQRLPVDQRKLGSLCAGLEGLVPEKAPWYTHTLEGSDDATSHIRAMLTETSLSIPVDSGRLCMGPWQGIYVFEHRARTHTRKVLLRVMGVR